MIDTEAMKSETVKVKRKSRKPVPSAVTLEVMFEGKVVESINPNSVRDWALENHLDPIACESITSKPWCTVDGYSFVRKGV